MNQKRKREKDKKNEERDNNKSGWVKKNDVNYCR